MSAAQPVETGARAPTVIFVAWCPVHGPLVADLHRKDALHTVCGDQSAAKECDRAGGIQVSRYILAPTAKRTGRLPTLAAGVLALLSLGGCIVVPPAAPCSSTAPSPTTSMASACQEATKPLYPPPGDHPIFTDPGWETCR